MLESPGCGLFPSNVASPVGYGMATRLTNRSCAHPRNKESQSTPTWNRSHELVGTAQHDVPVFLSSPIAGVSVNDVNDLDCANETTLRQVLGQQTMEAHLSQKLKTSWIEPLTCVDQQGPPMRGRPSSIFDIFVTLDDCPCPRLSHRQSPQLIH